MSGQSSRRVAGILLPAFSARRDGDLGIGDTRALLEWIDLLADHQVGLLQLLPINELGSVDSPYDAISSVALEPLYLSMEDVPGIDLGELDRAATEVGEGSVDYGRSRATKLALLEAAWQRWTDASPDLQKRFAEFREREARWLDDYCSFRVLVEKADSAVWDDWPNEWQEVDAARSVAAEHPERISFFAWLQWLGFEQWGKVRRHADQRGVKLMGDIPIGVSRYSADVFFGRDDFDLDWCGGAPPETMFKHDAFIRKWGQNWGIPLYRWDKMRSEDYPWWRQRIEKLTSVFHVFRIDHVLGFYRIYAFPWLPQRNEEFLEMDGAQAAEATGGILPRWVPRPDDYVTNKQANLADGDRRLRVVLDAAGPGEVVGEDLGTVPDYVRPHLAELDIAGFRIPHWDADPQGAVVKPEDMDECAFATFATHDHDPISAQWKDIAARAASDDPEDAAEATALWKRLADFAGVRPRGSYTSRVRWSLIDALMRSHSRYAAIMVNDLFMIDDRINQPGTIGPHNWSFRLESTVDQLRGRPEWARLAESIVAAERGISR
ncbi:MAG: 4-alpha-glucanotransferase [Acidimicrobiales bacterium]